MKITVQNLGKIENAEVELRPLRILVGKNNTGKSFLATAIWAVGNIDSYVLADRLLEKRFPEWLEKFLTEKSPIGRRITIDRPRWGQLLRLFLDNFHNNLEYYLSRVFAVDGFKGTSIDISDFEFEQFDLEFANNPWDDLGKDSRSSFSLVASWEDGRSEYLTLFSGADTNFRTYRSVGEIAGAVIFGKEWGKYSRQMYIPASRTGLMLALPALIESSFGTHTKGAGLNLPTPLLSFLNVMTRERIPHRSHGAEEALKTINGLIGGEIRSVSGQTGVFRYTPRGHEVELPMHATSSMIAELTPLLIAAENAGVSRHFVLEEPEAHLHLEAQREIARLVARLVASGAHITLTTHSDTFLQEINNLMKLHGHPDRERMLKKLGYEAHDMIDPDVCVAYEFTNADGKSKVTPLEKSSGGLIVPSLNETLISLAEDTLLLSASDDD